MPTLIGLDLRISNVFIPLFLFQFKYEPILLFESLINDTSLSVPNFIMVVLSSYSKFSVITCITVFFLLSCILSSIVIEDISSIIPNIPR